MARRTRRKSRPSDRAPPTIPDYVPEATRGPYVTATAPAVRLPVIKSPRSVRDLWAFEDRRTWHPDPVRPAASLSKFRQRLRVLPPNAMGAKRPTTPRAKRGYGVVPDLLRRASGVSAQVGFVAPSSVLVCVRRRMRRAVLISKGVSSRKPRKWSSFSKIVCRR